MLLYCGEAGKLLKKPRMSFRLLAMGITISIMLQVFINKGAVLKLFPLQVTLPLVSYGNSSLIVTLSELGILFNIARGRIGENDFIAGGEQRAYFPFSLYRSRRKGKPASSIFGN